MTMRLSENSKNAKKRMIFIVVKGQLLTKFMPRYVGGHATQTVSVRSDRWPMALSPTAHSTSRATGRPRADDREVVNGILYVLHTGCRWEDLPHDIQASPKTCNRRLLEYQRRRVWQRMVAELMKEADSRGC